MLHKSNAKRKQFELDSNARTIFFSFFYFYVKKEMNLSASGNRMFGFERLEWIMTVRLNVCFLFRLGNNRILHVNWEREREQKRGNFRVRIKKSQIKTNASAFKWTVPDFEFGLCFLSLISKLICIRTRLIKRISLVSFTKPFSSLFYFLHCICYSKRDRIKSLWLLRVEILKS